MSELNDATAQHQLELHLFLPSDLPRLLLVSELDEARVLVRIEHRHRLALSFGRPIIVFGARGSLACIEQVGIDLALARRFEAPRLRLPGHIGRQL